MLLCLMGSVWLVGQSALRLFAWNCSRVLVVTCGMPLALVGGCEIAVPFSQDGR